MNVFPLINQAWAAFSPSLRRALLALVLLIAAVFTITVVVLGWRDGRIPNALGLVATKQDLKDQTKQLVAMDSAKVQAVAEATAAAAEARIMDYLAQREQEARANILNPLLMEMKGLRTDVSMLSSAQQVSGRQMRELPRQMSQQLETMLEASKPPRTTEDMLQELMRNQARQDSILNSFTAPQRKRMTKAPTM